VKGGPYGVAAGKLNHPNVIPIYEICQQAQMYYLVLEYGKVAV
jgi:hypothetical protein